MFNADWTAGMLTVSIHTLKFTFDKKQKYKQEDKKIR